MLSDAAGVVKKKYAKNLDFHHVKYEMQHTEKKKKESENYTSCKS